MKYRFWKMNSICTMQVKKKEKLLFCLVDLHPHIFVHWGHFVSITSMLCDLVIQILHICCGCLEGAVHTNILALERYHGFSPAAYMIGYIFIHFCTFQKLWQILRDILMSRFIPWDMSLFSGQLLRFFHLSDASCLNTLSWIYYRFQISIKTGILFQNQEKRVITLQIRSQD